eukprot:6183451-Pleurochrysis_carterae.AAC.1
MCYRERRRKRGREWERETVELDGASGACTSGSVATVYAPLPLPVLTSDGDDHVFRHVVDGRFAARGNLHRDLDLTAGRSADLARARPLGYYAVGSFSGFASSVYCGL